MTLDELNGIDITKPDQIKGLQELLKARGYYSGPIDGKWGGGTTAAASRLRDELNTHENNQLGIAKATEKANDPANRALNLAVDVGPYAAGGVGGAIAGRIAASRFNQADTAQRASVKDLAARSDISPAMAKAEMNSARSARNWGTGAQFLYPAAAFGSAEYLRNNIAPRFDPETQKWINLGANADQGLGFGLLLHQLADLPNRIRSPNDPVDSALINTRASAPPDTPPAAPAAPAGPKPGTKPALYADAKARGLPVTTRMSKADIEATLARALKASSKAAKAIADKGSGAIVPAAVGYSVYDALRNPAEASDGSTPEGMGRGEAAAIGAGAGAATGYGIDRLRQALSKVPAVGRALNFIGERTGPLMLNDMATGLGSYLDSKGIMPNPDQRVADLSGASELPQRNPLRSEPSPGNQYYPLSSGQMPPTGTEQVQNGSSVEPGNGSALPSFGSLDELAAAAEQDPQLAAMIRELVTARLGQAQAQ